MTAQHSASDWAHGLLPQSGNVVGGKYRVDAFIARGGMGAVLAATHTVTGRRVALKWMLPQPEQDAEATHRLVREARAAARVRHPNVVDVYDVGEHEGALFLVMELLEGQTLHARLKAGGPLEPSTAVTLLLPALRGVEAAHQSHVVHRDLKPSNIFVCREPGSTEPVARVLDFGISKILSSAGDGERSITRTGAVLGTPHYMPPEQLTDEPTDARADIYAAGVILYQCLTGRLPFQEQNYNALVLQIATATPPSVSELAPRVPLGLNAVVMRAMAREPRDRFASMGALIDALLPFSMDAAPAAAAPRRSGRWLWAALLACAFGAVAAWASRDRSASDGATLRLASPAAPVVRVVEREAVQRRPSMLTAPAESAPSSSPSLPSERRPRAVAATGTPTAKTARERASAGRVHRAPPVASTVPEERADSPGAKAQPIHVSLDQF